MFKNFLFLFLLLNHVKASHDIAHINIVSNVKDTKIYLDGKFIGITPIERFEVESNKNIELNASANSQYYPKSYLRNIKVDKSKINSYEIEIEKIKAKIELIGKDGYLFINDSFTETLNSTNRIIEVIPNENIKIEIQNGDKKFITYKDMNASGFYQIKYNLDSAATKDSKDLDNNSSNKYQNIVTIGDLVWQDTLTIIDLKLLYSDAVNYCQELELAEFNDWTLPSIEQLNLLEIDKIKFRNKFTNNIYVSSTKGKGDYIYWDYLLTKNFETNKIDTINGSAHEANLICVRKIVEEE